MVDRLGIGGVIRVVSAEVEGSAVGHESPGVVWIYCPYPVVAAGLSDALENKFGVHLGRSAPDHGVPCCAILDTDGTENLAEGIKRIHGMSPEIPILVFGLRVDLPLARAALRLGARGFIHAGMELEQVARATEVAASGEIVVPRTILEQLVTNEDPADLDALTNRQREILELVAKGYSNARIAQDLFLSESTVKQHLRATYKILGVNDRKEAAKLINGR
jgi:DNA-binding NarL/FixJ family response regulator